MSEGLIEKFEICGITDVLLTVKMLSFEEAKQGLLLWLPLSPN